MAWSPWSRQITDGRLWPMPGGGAQHDDVVLSRLEDQAAYYEAKARRYARAFKGFKTLQIVAAAAIPVEVALPRPAHRRGGLRPRPPRRGDRREQPRQRPPGPRGPRRRPGPPTSAPCASSR